MRTVKLHVEAPADFSGACGSHGTGDPGTFHSLGGWFRGMAHGIGHRNAEIRTAHYQASFEEDACARFARDLVAAKIRNQRTILRRNWREGEEGRKVVLDRLDRVRRAASHASSIDVLRGLDGEAAAAYFRAIVGLLVPPVGRCENGEGELAPFRFEARNRRPPTDPANAMLSFEYAMLTRHLTVAVASVGLDPYRGLYHALRRGRPTLALDLMEPFRPIIADSVVLSAINCGRVTAGDSISGTTGTALTGAGRRKFTRAFERRLLQETTHPLFRYRLSMRRLLIVQARLRSRHLLGELPVCPHYVSR